MWECVLLACHLFDVRCGLVCERKGKQKLGGHGSSSSSRAAMNVSVCVTVPVHLLLKALREKSQFHCGSDRTVNGAGIAMPPPLLHVHHHSVPSSAAHAPPAPAAAAAGLAAAGASPAGVKAQLRFIYN
jgi:hypothetical protein